MMRSSNDFKRFYNAFREVSKAVHASTSVDDVMELVVWKAAQVLDGKGSVLRILNLTTEKLELSASYGLSKKYLSKGPVTSHKIITDLCKKNKVIIIDDIQSDPRVLYPKEAVEEGIWMILDIPLRLRDDIIGIIRIFFSEPRKFEKEELNFIVAISEQCACAIDKARLIEEQQSRFHLLASQTEKLSSLGRMAAGIAHEINNPLGGILLFSSNMLKKVPEDGPLKEGLEVIISESQRCKGIIQGLLEFSRDRTAKKVMTNINDIIDKVVNMLDNKFSINRIQVLKQIDREMPDTKLDVNQMQQVFVNLLLNAVEAIKENGVITIKSYPGPDRESGIVEIEDTGCGIHLDDLAKIFDPFFSTKSNGTGLGLSISYGIIQKHEGDIEVSSKTGQGTRFTIKFPISIEPNALEYETS